MSSQPDVPAPDHHNLLPPGRPSKDGGGRAPASYGGVGGGRGASYTTTIAPGPGSFSSELRSTTTSRSDNTRPPLIEQHTAFAPDEGMRTASEARQAELRDQIEKETKIKIGSENLLEALNTKSAKQAKEQKSRVEAELNISNRKLANLRLDLETEMQRSKEPVSSEGRLSFLFRSAPSRAESYQNPDEVDPDSESPTLVLADILQALEAEGLAMDYYVEKGNSLVELFKRHPTLKYDLAWSVFGLRVQNMLLSDSREVAAAGYRVMRYAIADRKSLQTIRSFHTDYLVILSLVKESKVSVEREQALKFVRAFLEVKDGHKEISRAVIRIIVAVAEHTEDRLRNISILTLAEILVKDPERLVSSGVPALLHAEEDSINLTLKRKTTLLLGEVLKMANELLPPSWSAELQVLPDLLKSASQFGADERFIATGTIYQVDSVNRTLFRSGGNEKFGGGAEHEELHTPHLAKKQFSAQIDEASFRNLMAESRVLETPNYQKWRWDLVLGILDGPLYNPKRLDEALRATKFIHRLINFFRPFKHRFSILKNTRPNQRYVRAGCSLMRALLNNADGARYLMDSKPIRQLGECLSHFDRMSGLTSEEPIFSAERMAETLTGGYFAMLGELSKKPEGVHIFERWKMINMFYHIVELRDRDDLMKTLLSNMDYTLDGHLRIILSKAMTAGTKEIRIFSTRLVRKYATKPLQHDDAPMPGTGVAEWAIRLLVTQLYDPDVEVCEVAIKILEEACNQKRSLEYVVKCAPTLDHLSEIGAPLLLRFLSTSVGYHYLDGLDYITREMDDWFLGRNDSYVALVEASLARALADIPEKPPSHLAFDELPDPMDYGLVPPHFYRELARTFEGCKLLEAKGHFEEFASTIKEYCMEKEDTEIILKVKGCLWAVGNVGSMDLGAPFLESTDVTRHIVRIAEESEVMSLRGTAFFVLGLISRSLHGQEILIECGWDAATNIMGESLGFCMPLDFKKLFSLKPWKSSFVAVKTLRTPTDAKNGITDDDPINARILKLVVDLGNTVLAKRAATDLHNIKTKKAPGFQKPAMFHKVMAILELHHFRLPVCRFVIDLFDKNVLRQIVLEEEESSSEGEEEEEDDDDDDDDDSDGNEPPPTQPTTQQPPPPPVQPPAPLFATNGTGRRPSQLSVEIT
ncbi:putative cytosolic regulator pianissimo [Diplodia seriata]|uniref:Putative cytosolic regulator pianissimo n=1 Tax=Diplodia seriata TaxID=420778 RepID=A0A0G2EFC6_9PEZI|nr:putative cytosolic regulator pianissimo [Diplodia seriata]